jgi:hypothetical protein
MDLAADATPDTGEGIDRNTRHAKDLAAVPRTRVYGVVCFLRGSWVASKKPTTPVAAI